jgi:hypothetical protein
MVQSYDGSLALVVGWVLTPQEINPRTGYVRRHASWEVTIVIDQRVKQVHWEQACDNWTLAEWEQL